MLVGLLVVASNTVAEDKVVKRSDAEKKAIAAIEKLGGRVTFDEKKQGQPVIGVDLYDTKTTDAGLAHAPGRGGGVFGWVDQDLEVIAPASERTGHPGPAHQHPRSRDLAAIDPIAHLEDRNQRRAEIDRGRDPSEEQLARRDLQDLAHSR